MRPYLLMRVLRATGVLRAGRPCIETSVHQIEVSRRHRLVRCIRDFITGLTVARPAPEPTA